ncbi:MAG: hypothetical protein GX575_02725 [Candidatus Anammoximicrobium sp.]|nr:hypothetical protein [Candidatus Anammoximicrobium sp.]
MNRIVPLAGLVTLCPFTTPRNARQWPGGTGVFTIEAAELVEATGDSVRLRKADGQVAKFLSDRTT